MLFFAIMGVYATINNYIQHYAQHYAQPLFFK